MKLSENTLSILKNYALINSGIVLKKGNIQKTIAPDKAILAEAELEDSFPVEFGIYDLNQFLRVVTTLSEPDLDFTDKYVEITDGTDNTVFQYYKCYSELVISPPDKSLSLKTPDVSFELPNATFTKLLRLGAMNNLPNLSVIGEKGKLSIQTHEKSNNLSNCAKIKLGEFSGKDFSASFKIENLKMLEDDYKVGIKLGAFAKFTSKSKKLTYYVALETK